jgi:hypothetical protein
VRSIDDDVFVNEEGLWLVLVAVVAATDNDLIIGLARLLITVSTTGGKALVEKKVETRACVPSQYEILIMSHNIAHKIFTKGGIVGVKSHTLPHISYREVTWLS